METNSIYEESYDQIKKLIKANTTSSITIEYDKLDTESAGEIRGAIDRALLRRKREVEYVVLNHKDPF